jgi:hypothetical protein
MKNLSKQFICAITLFLVFGFSSCEDESEVLSTELNIQQKVTLLESNEWLLKGFEDRVMHTFKDGEQLTYYGADNVFDENPIPGTFAYIIIGNSLSIDYNFGTIRTYELIFSCNNNIVELSENREPGGFLYKRGSNYQECL